MIVNYEENMNYREKQATIQKLARVRLAINHVIRQRAMQKQSMWPFTAAQPNYTPRGDRTWDGWRRSWYSYVPRFEPGSEAELEDQQRALDRSERFLGQGRYARPNTGTPRVGDSANGRSVERQGNSNSK